jgi:hypothetical protein
MYRNKKLLESARDESCVCCGAHDTVVWAHSNRYKHGKGRGLKANDIFGAYLCHVCHSEFDAHKIPSRCTWYNYDLEHFFLQAWEMSIIRAVDRGYV